MVTTVGKYICGRIKMPSIGLGTFTLTDVADPEETLNTALELGYRNIDTAFAYKNEVQIGKVLKKWFSSGKLKRDDIFITTKLPVFGVHKDRVETFMKKSLQNLQLDYVDLYLIHFAVCTKYYGADSQDNYKDIDDTDHLEVWKKMEEQVDAGRTKAIGLSNFNQKQVERILNSARIKPACLQLELHVDFQQRELVEYCQENGILVVAYSPLGAPGAKRFEDRSIPAIIHSDEIKKIAQKYNKTPGQVMLRYLLQKNIVPVPKSANPQRLKENLDVFDFEISSEDMRILDGLERGKEGRLGAFRYITGIKDHPEYPFEV